MIRYWLNLKTLKYRFNDLEYGVARTDAENWLDAPVGWFSSPEAMNAYIQAETLPVLTAAWKANPHMRLGQLVANAAGGDPFYTPDGELRDQLATHANHNDV